MNQAETLLEIKDLCVEFKTMAGTVRAVDHLSYSLKKGEKLGIVGESGSGKSVSSLAMMQLIPNPPGKVTGGRILYRGNDLVQLSEREMQKIRGNEISMIFQEPMTSLNPIIRCGASSDTELFKNHRSTIRFQGHRIATCLYRTPMGGCIEKTVAFYIPHNLKIIKYAQRSLLPSPGANGRCFFCLQRKEASVKWQYFG